MLRSMRRRLAAILTRSRFEDEMRDELRSHLEHRIDDLVASGMTREDAARQARTEFGAMEAYKEQCRDSRGFTSARVAHGVWGDLKLAARRLIAAPLFLLFAVLSLAVGLGVTITAYAVIESLFWRPLGIVDQARVAVVTVPSRGERAWRRQLSRDDFEQLGSQQRVFSRLAAAATFGEPLATAADIEPVRGEAVSADFFDVVGVRAERGRMIQPPDEEGAAAVIVLSDRLWRIGFGRDPEIIGRVVRLGSHPFEIVGVAPPTFTGISGGYPLEAWIPLSATSLFSSSSSPLSTEMSVVGRLAKSETMSSAAREIAAIAARLDVDSPIQRTTALDAPPVAVTRQWSVQQIDRDSDEAIPLGMLLVAIVGLVLLVACTNLANLMLARGTMRQHDLAVRRALGASRWRLVREQFIEAGVIAVLGALATVAVTKSLLTFLPAGLPDNGFTFPLDPVVSPSVLVVAAVALLFALLTFGLEPAIQLTRTVVTSDLAGESGAVGVPRAQRQRAFIRWQVAICTCFFLIAALLAKVVVQASLHDSGVDLDRLAFAAIRGEADWDESRARRTVDAALEAARREPGIQAVAVTTGFPFGLPSEAAALRTPERPFSEGRPEQITDTLIAATPDLFRTLGIPILSGRGFTVRDDAGSAPVAILSETTARRLFGTRDAVGRQILVQQRRRSVTAVVTATIVGVARDTDQGRLTSRQGDFGTLYRPFAQHFDSRMFLVARTASDPAVAARSLQMALRRVDPNLAAAASGPAATLLAEGYLIARMAASAAGALGLLTLLLAAVGLYGVQSQIVAHRTREVGVRVALGATKQHIERLVLSDGLKPVVQGLALGLMLGIIVRLAIRVLFGAGLDPIDLPAIALAPIPLVVAAFLACKIPAARAARVDPKVALRHL